MGEIADLMLDGDICQVCGEELGAGNGYPRSCAGCTDPDEVEPEKKQNLKRIICNGGCGKRFSTVEAMTQHFRAKHSRIR